MKMDKKILLLFAIFGILLGASMLSTYATFSGSHTVEENKSTPAEFCVKCHPTKVSSVGVSAHANAGCICHGYNPNLTALYNINAAHNLTKQIYCTNCHANYSMTTGSIVIHNDGSSETSVTNQSAHYIIRSSTNRTPVYERAKQFFANSSG